jgi:curved DNA-binding protein
VEFQDYYTTLGVPKTASEKEIRTAYRKLARKHHPDVNPGNKEAEERFKQINEAYEVLSDPEKRRRYDEVGSHWREYEQWQRAQHAAGQRSEPFDWAGFGGAGAGGAGAGAGPGGVRYEYRTVDEDDLRDMFGDEAPFSDFFQTFFRGGQAGAASGRRTRSRGGTDAEHPIDVTLAEAYRGTTRQLTLQLPNGQTRRIEVKIPPGVRTGSRVRVAGQGGPGEGGAAAGDLFLAVEVRPDPRFERRGDDLYTTVPAPLETLLLGGEVHVPTPDGRTLALTVPAGSQDGRTFRLRGQGMPHLGRPERRGDLHAAVHVRLPERLTPRQRELIEEFGRAGSETAAGGVR